MPPSDAANLSATEMMNIARNGKRTSAKTKEKESMWDSTVDGCCGQQRGDLVPPWMDWVESGIEFFGCEGEPGGGKSVIGRALTLQYGGEQTETTTEDRDFAQLHEEFFESLLKEQIVTPELATPPGLTKAESHDESSTCSASSSAALSSASSFTTESEAMTVGSESLSSTATLKRRRPLKLHKRSPRRKNHPRIAPIEAYNKKYNPANKNKISLEDIASKDIKEPSAYMHPKCALQKDKGKGTAIGSAISAEGRENCLEKLREKMSIVVQVSGEERQAATDMKRRVAKVTAHTPAYIETRSIIELRLGFLSMQYGLLLQWDHAGTGKIQFMVLRKMCHDSFYTKAPNILQQETLTTTITRRQLEAPPLVVRNMIGNHAIYQRLLGTEVVLVDPPYRVPQPEAFAPSILKVAIKNITGLSKKSRWTVSMTFNGHTEVSNLQYVAEKKVFEPRQTGMKWEMLPMTSFDLAGLEIRLFEEHKRKKARSRLVTTMTLPLGGLVAQPSTSQSTSWQLTMPFTHDPTSNLTISLSHQSDYAHWLYKELDARRNEEVSGFVWKAPFRRFARKSKNGDESSGEDVWDWLCGICFKEYYLP
mmetsp:Transcript_108556/g.162381  ORF Transcript_108556/g.162381 Transcript_108556/m.162381 type:complete len:593 (+) Transcript_108556:147-1925(+)